MPRPPVLILVPAGAALAGCSGGPHEPDFRSALPAARIDAIATARDGDPASRRALIEQLDAADPAVRMLAITRLQRETGETHDYDFAGPQAERDAAVLRWMATLEEPAP